MAAPPSLKINVGAAKKCDPAPATIAVPTTTTTNTDSLYHHVERVGKVLGEGASGIVELVHHKSKPTQYFAMKTIACVTSKHVRYIQREIEALSGVPDDSPLLSCFDVYYNKCETTVHIITEYMNKGCLQTLLGKGPMPEDVASYVMLQILRGLHILHKMGRIHRDLKPSNILLNDAGKIKISDFGLSREYTDDKEAANGAGPAHHKQQEQQTFVGTLIYMAPERLEAKAQYDAKADVWSLGLSAIEMLTAQHPYADVVQAQSGDTVTSSFFTLYQRVRSGAPPGLPSGHAFSPAAVEFVTRCVSSKPEERADTEELLRLPWMVNAPSHKAKFEQWLATV